MRTAIVLLASVALVAVVGCKTSSRGGGAVPTEGFKINVPANVDLKQGESKAITLSLDRGEYFRRDVRLNVRTSSEDIRVEPAEIVVEASEMPDVQMRVMAATDAALGEYRVHVTGTPEAGVPATVDFTVDVSAP